MRSTKLGEFDLIELIRRRAGTGLPADWEGIGDDCAVLPWSSGESLLLTTDMLVEGTHFRMDWTTPYQLGVKALAVNLSDVAAMGGRPVASLLAIGLPPGVGHRAERGVGQGGDRGVEMAWAEEFLRGYSSFGVPLIGGDTTASENGITLSITALGIVENTHLKRRSGAQAGDLIGVTGWLGSAAGGLKALQSGIYEADSLLEALHTPRPHLPEGAWLGAQPGVHAMMDVSDGVAGDLRHILKASGVAAQVDLEKLPISSDLQRVALKNGWNATELALTGGEDYVLLFTFDPALKQQIEEQGFTIIGRVVSANADTPGRIDFGGECNGLDFRGYSHF